MTIDWKAVLAAVAAALIGAGGTVGAQKIAAATPPRCRWSRGPARPPKSRLLRGRRGPLMTASSRATRARWR